MKVNEKKDILMDAIGSIDPKYIEEARQAVSPDSGRKSLFSRWSVKLAHSRTIQLTAAACLLLLVLTGASQTGILSDLIIFHSDRIQTFSDRNISQEAQDKDTVKENEIAGSGDSQSDKSTSSHAQSSEATPEAEAAANIMPDKNPSDRYDSMSVLTEPPMLSLYVLPSTEDYRIDRTEDEKITPYNSISVPRNNYEWTYDEGNGQKTSSIACGSSDIWNSSDLPVLTLKSEEAIGLNFDDNPPDSLAIRCLPASKTGSDNLEAYYMEITPQEDGSISLPENELSCIVEITASWENEFYSGQCTYGFRTECTE